MRIIAGQWRGRTIRAPRDRRVRPTGDRAREAWMSIVQPILTGARVLDLYAGSGALGLEALSRGAAQADFVDVSLAAIKVIRENGTDLGALEQMRIHRGEALRFAQKLDAGAYDVAFADPPYNLGMAPRLATWWLRVPFADVIGIEHDVHEALPEGGQMRTYGDTAVTIYRVENRGEGET